MPRSKLVPTAAVAVSADTLARGVRPYGQGGSVVIGDSIRRKQ